MQAGGTTQQVIISVDDSATRAGIRQALIAHGDSIKSDLVGAFSATIHSDDVAVVAKYRGRSSGVGRRGCARGAVTSTAYRRRPG